MGAACRMPARALLLLALAVALSWSSLWSPPVGAAPFTSHFDELIAILNERLASFGENPDKAAKKTQKKLLKVLKVFDKESKSLATDIKNAGKVSKALAKLYPEEMAVPSGALGGPLREVFDDLRGDVQTALNGANDVLDTYGPSSCKDKAAASLEKGQGLLDAGTASAEAGDFKGAAKSLGAALKAALKGDKKARSAKCAAPLDGNNPDGGIPDGGNPGGNPSEFLRATISGAENLDFAALGSVQSDSTYDSFSGQLSVYGTDNPKRRSILLVAKGVTVAKEYPLEYTSSFLDIDVGIAYGIVVTGKINFTVVDFEKPELTGTFEATMKQYLPQSSEAAVTISNGSFRILNVNGLPTQQY